ncbi:MAG TPA: hypothetical protein VGJ70_05195 [Solirubrobacteraceae bacterium]
MAWLYGLHARTSIVRGTLWQAEYMVSAARDHVLALAALRHGLPTAYGRGWTGCRPRRRLHSRRGSSGPSTPASSPGSWRSSCAA